MSAYIDADHYAERLRQLRLAYSAKGRQKEAAGIEAALRMLATEPDWERTDVRDKQWLDHLHMDDDAERIEIVKARMAEELGRYAAKQGLFTYKDACPYGSARVLELHAAFLTPRPPVFKEPQEVDEDAGSKTD